MTTIRIQGYVVRADVLQPFTTYHDDKARYELVLLPSNPNIVHELEYQIDEAKDSFNTLKNMQCRVNRPCLMLSLKHF